LAGLLPRWDSLFPSSSDRENPNGNAAWVPVSAREVRLRQDLNADEARQCGGAADPIALGKKLAIAMELPVREATATSDDEEAALGRQLEEAAPNEDLFRGKLDLPDDVRRYGGYFQALVDHLAKNKTRKGISYRVHVVRNDDFNAVAIAGGVLYAFTGLVDGPQRVRSEAELAGVLGHEIAHVEKRHTMVAVQLARAALGTDAPVGAILMRLVTRPLQSEYELEADREGLKLVALGQYDPMATVEHWALEADRPGKTRPSAIRGAAETLLGTHPPAEQRRCACLETVAWAKGNGTSFDRFYIGTTNVRELVVGPSRPH
jgi:hypothetical protein